MQALAELEESPAPVVLDAVEPARAALCHLSELRAPAAGVVAGLDVRTRVKGGHGITPEELERRLLEIGFVEGARIQVIHEGLIGRDPLVVRLNGMRIALRRREAQAVLVRIEP